jgi:hypothetical protein
MCALSWMEYSSIAGRELGVNLDHLLIMQLYNMADIYHSSLIDTILE